MFKQYRVPIGKIFFMRINGKYLSTNLGFCLGVDHYSSWGRGAKRKKRFVRRVAEKNPSMGSLHEVRRTCRTSPAKMKNVRRRTPVKFNQMSGKEVKKTSCRLHGASKKKKKIKILFGGLPKKKIRTTPPRLLMAYPLLLKLRKTFTKFKCFYLGLR